MLEVSGGKICGTYWNFDYGSNCGKEEPFNIMMIDIASTLNYAEFDEVKGCGIAHEMWNKLKYIYEGDDNVRRAKAESLIGQFDQMKMKENESIAQYSERIKASVSAIRAPSGKIDDVMVVSKVFRTLHPVYAINVLAIQEMRCDPKNDITLDALVGMLTIFELDKFDNYIPNSINLESAFQAKLSLKKKDAKSKRKRYDSEDEDGSDDGLEVFEVFLSRRFPKGKGH